MDAARYIWAKPANMLTLQFWSIKRKFSLWDLVECSGTAYKIEWEILDAYCGVEKPLTKEAIFIKKLKPQLKTSDG